MPSSLPIYAPGERDHPEGRPDPVDPVAARRKLESLRRDLANRAGDGILVAFSGGMDSAFLLWAAAQAARDAGGQVLALTTISPSTPAQDREDALAFSRPLEVEHLWRESLEVDLPTYLQNDQDRCYHCKTELFRIAAQVARTRGLRWLAYGYNASDREDDRPGHRAAREAGALAPLADVGLTKPEIRLLMEEEDLPLARKPASPCLSSRIMTGIPISPERLRDVEAMEAILRDAGISTLRVRICRDMSGSLFVRVETAPEEMGAVLKVRNTLQKAATARGYRWVTLDLGGYRTGGGIS
jgi:uncharacterized protein